MNVLMEEFQHATPLDVDAMIGVYLFLHLATAKRRLQLEPLAPACNPLLKQANSNITPLPQLDKQSRWHTHARKPQITSAQTLPSRHCGRNFCHWHCWRGSSRQWSSVGGCGICHEHILRMRARLQRCCLQGRQHCCCWRHNLARWGRGQRRGPAQRRREC